MAIRIKTAKEIEKMRRSGQAATRVLQAIGEAVRPGVSTLELDRISREQIDALGGTSSFLGHRPQGHPAYPATICASPNNEIVHGIPREDCILADGDIVSIDVAVRLDGYHGDNAFTFRVGQAPEEAERLTTVTRGALDRAIDAATPSNRLGDVGFAVQEHVEASGFSVIRALCGHGIGRSMWETPQIPNHGSPGTGPRLRPGMVLAIEPMITAGGPEITFLPDGWGTATADDSLSAHFEHTVAILSDGPEVLTANPALWG